MPWRNEVDELKRRRSLGREHGGHWRRRAIPMAELVPIREQPGRGPFSLV